MKRSETSAVLTRIASMDNRRLDDPNASVHPILDAWHDAIGDLSLRDCIEAVRVHRQESSEWIQPHHVRAIVRKVRDARIDAARPTIEALTEDVDPRDSAAYLATYRARLKAIGDGATLDQAKALPLPAEARHAAIDRVARPVLTIGDR